MENMQLLSSKPQMKQVNIWIKDKDIQISSDDESNEMNESIPTGRLKEEETKSEIRDKTNVFSLQIPWIIPKPSKEWVVREIPSSPIWTNMLAHSQKSKQRNWELDPDSL